PENWDVDGLIQYLGQYFPIAPDTTIPAEAMRGGQAGLIDFLDEAARTAYDQKVEQIGPEIMRQVERYVMLRAIDTKWIDYLTQMEHFREGIGLRAYGQRDPLIEYKNEAFQMFQELVESIQADIVANMFRVQVQPAETPSPPVPAAQPVRSTRMSGPNGDVPSGAPARVEAVPAAVGAATKLGRNDPCWCGSGKKYKRCHGR
ncbi:MAG TPA: SEC-C metal-binding domain-containing protein, partial [Candidatus Dormibacteraeota bacterium]